MIKIKKEHKGLIKKKNDPLVVKFSDKEKKVLEVLEDPTNAKKSVRERAKIAGIHEASFYRIIKKPKIIRELRLRGILATVGVSLPIIRRMTKDALAGKFMQQKTLLEMSGLHSQVPQLQQFININIDQRGKEHEMDQKLVKLLTGVESVSDDDNIEDANIVQDKDLEDKPTLT